MNAALKLQTQACPILSTIPFTVSVREVRRVREGEGERERSEVSGFYNWTINGLKALYDDR